MTFTQDFFTSRRNIADGNTRIGDLDRLWYDPITNTIRVGNTLPGGLIVAGSSSGTSPLTTKGDLYTFDTTDAALPVGVDDYVLTADSTTATGLSWKPLSSGLQTALEGGNAATIYLFAQNVSAGGSLENYFLSQIINAGGA